MNVSTADEHIRVSERVKREIERRQRDGESYNDVLERVLSDERDFEAGFGLWSDERAARARAARRESKSDSKERARRLSEQNER